MDTKIFDKVIKETVKEVLEQMAFVEVIPCNELCKKFQEPIKVMLKINMPQEFIFLIECDERLVDEIAANIFGTSTDYQSKEVKIDVLAEIHNTITGRIMKCIIPNSKKFDLGIPLLNPTLTDKYNNRLINTFVNFDNLPLTFEVLFN